MYTCIHAYINIYVHTHIYTRAYTAMDDQHIFIHIYIHIHTQSWMINTFFVHIIIQTKIVVITKKTYIYMYSTQMLKWYALNPDNHIHTYTCTSAECERAPSAKEEQM